jgi:hypothetical protein
MPWKIIEQTEKHGKEEIPVKCKHVKFFPKTDGNGNVEGFGKLKNIVLSVIVENHKGYRLRLTASGDMMDPRFTITHPEKQEYPKIWIGEKKKRRQIYDYLSKMVTIKGEQEKYPYLLDFQLRIDAVLGKELAKEVMDAFVQRFASLAGAKLAA